MGDSRQQGFAGYSGGRKSVLPGIASYKTIMANHCAEFINLPCARPGSLKGNPIHQDMLYAAKTAGLKFILNVVLDGEGHIAGSFAGDLEAAHEKGCEFLSSLAAIKEIRSDITVVSNGGYPFDQNIYQAAKGLVTAEATNKEGGVIVMVAGLSDGTGGDHFYRNLAVAKSVQDYLKKVSCVGRMHTVADQWESQVLARILSKHKVIQNFVRQSDEPADLQIETLVDAVSPRRISERECTECSRQFRETVGIQPRG